jgi:hypothetical protein
MRRWPDSAWRSRKRLPSGFPAQRLGRGACTSHIDPTAMAGSKTVHSRLELPIAAAAMIVAAHSTELASTRRFAWRRALVGSAAWTVAIAMGGARLVAATPKADAIASRVSGAAAQRPAASTSSIHCR